MDKTVAIIGASADRRKYGNKAVRAFAQGGWTVYPVNPSLQEVEGLKCYASLSEVPDPVQRITVYVPPSVGQRLLEDIARKTHRELFFNPGSDNPELMEQARARGLQPIQACSIINIGLRPDMFPDA